MRLSSQEKERLRNEIEKLTQKVPNKELLLLNKDLLECLMFEKSVTLDNNIEAKFIVWSGDFLSKIDLSDVDFDNVVWDVLIHKNYHCFKHDLYNNIKEINLSNTNARIDFSKAYNNKDYGLIVNHCNFENVNLTRSKANYIKQSEHSNYKNTNANINLDISNGGINFTDCNLEGNDLYKYSINYEHLENYKKESDLSLSGSNLKNTGINIIYDYKRPNEYKKALPRINYLENLDFRIKTTEEKNELINYYHQFYKYIKLDREGYRLGLLIMEGNLNGCYVNSKLINIKQEYNIKNRQIKTLKKL